MLFIGNNLRLDGIPLRSGGVFCRSLSCTTSVPEWSDACCVMDTCSLRNFLKVAILHYFLSGVGVCGMPSALQLITKGRWGRGLARAGFEGQPARRACLPGR